MAIVRVPVNLTGFAGAPGVNVFHARVDDADPSGILQVLSGHLNTWYNSIIGFFATGVTVTMGDPIDVETNELVDPGTRWTATSSAGNSLPTAAAIVCGWRTSVHARRGMGRTFLGPLTATILQSDGTIADTSRTSLVAACNTLISNAQSVSGGMFGVYGYQSALAPGAARAVDAPRVLRDWQSVVVKDQFAVLRSRRD